MDESVTVFRSHDALQTELLADLLVDAGIPARVVGARAVLAEEAAERRIEVAAELAEDATALIAAFLAAAPEEFAEEPEPQSAAARPLRRVLAAGVAPVLPGGSHFYARRGITGGTILAGQVVAIWTMANGDQHAATVAAVVCCGLFLYDVVGGQLAVAAWNQGVRASPARQLAAGAAAICVLGAVGVAAAPWLPRLSLGRGGGRGPGADRTELRKAASSPDSLPFPLHLDLQR